MYSDIAVFIEDNMVTIEDKNMMFLLKRFLLFTMHYLTFFESKLCHSQTAIQSNYRKKLQ